MSLWVNERGELMLLVGFVKHKGTYLFETETNVIRETTLHPQEWGWEIVDVF